MTLQVEYVDFEVCAAAIDPKDYKWYTYTGTRKKTYENLHRSHPLVMQEGDKFGVREKLNGTMSVVKSDHQLVQFNFKKADLRKFKELMKKAKKYKGKIAKYEGKGRKSVTGRKDARNRTDRLNGDVLFAPKVSSELQKMDRANYQYRKATKDINLVSKAGKSKGIIKKGDRFGMRSKGAGREGYVLLMDDNRFMLAAKTMKALFSDSKIAKEKYQRTGVIDMSKRRSEEQQQKALLRDQRHAEAMKHRKLINAEDRKRGVTRKGDVSFDDDNSFDDEHNPEVPEEDLPSLKQRNSPKIKRRIVRRGVKLADLDNVKEDKVQDRHEKTKHVPKDHGFRPAEPEDDSDDTNKKSASEIKFSEWDLITFEDDPEEIDWMITEIDENDRFLEYTVYNMTDRPEFIQKFRLTTAALRKGDVKSAILVRKGKKREIAQLEKQIDVLEFNKKEKVITW